jgi:hypothetical protein
MEVHSGELIWSDETYKILGFARQTNPTLDLVFDRVHPEDRNRLQQIRDHATYQPLPVTTGLHTQAEWEAETVRHTGGCVGGYATNTKSRGRHTNVFRGRL